MVNVSYFCGENVCVAVLWFLVLSVVLRLGYCQGLTFGLSFFVFELSGFRFGNCIRGPSVKIDIDIIQFFKITKNHKHNRPIALIFHLNW